jgi:uncharacterized membrane protein YphA (DoxX/SURF4 family)
MSTLQEAIAAPPAPSRMPRWKSIAGATAAILLSLLFFVSGIWKLTDLDATAQRMIQSLVPVALSMPAALAVAVFETFTAVLLLIPRYRRWGAWLAALMLVAFMIYIGVLYNRLIGEDCNCFPWVRRVVGPAFFAGDAAMLALAAFAARWSVESRGWRRAAIILSCVCLVAGASYAVTAIRRGGADAPETAVVDGQPLKLREGRVLLYFFDPECLHCLGVAREMSKRDWGATRVVTLPTRQQRFAADFLASAGFRAGISLDAALLRNAFPFTDPPYAVALERGKAVATFNSGQMESDDYYQTLARLGHLVRACAGTESGTPR